jgi:hypothetical protein
MRALPIAARAALPKLKLKLPTPKTTFRTLLPSQTPKTVEPQHAPPLPEARPRPRNVPTEETRERVRSEPQPLELDSAARTAVMLAPPAHSVPVAAPPPSSPTQQPIPHTLAAELLEKAAFWGDGTRGHARLRFNHRARAGLANATNTLEHDGDEMHLRVEGVDDGDLENLGERLAARGVTISGES